MPKNTQRTEKSNITPANITGNMLARLMKSAREEAARVALKQKKAAKKQQKTHLDYLNKSIERAAQRGNLEEMVNAVLPVNAAFIMHDLCGGNMDVFQQIKRVAKLLREHAETGTFPPLPQKLPKDTCYVFVPVAELEALRAAAKPCAGNGACGQH